jgi:predicted Zn-dependent peptidase
MGYHKPDMYHEDDAVFDAVSDLMGNGRTSRLYERMVKEDKIAIAAGGFSGLLGGKYPDLFIFFALPAQGHTAEECEAAILEEIERLKGEPVTLAELEKAQTRARAGLIRQMNSNNGITSIMTSTKALKGDWRDAWYELDRIDAVTAEDIQRVASEYFTPSNRTVGISKPMEPAS